MTDVQLGQLGIFVTSFCALVASIAQIIAANRKETRNRQWIVEDRQAAMAEIVERAKAEAAALRIKTEATAEALMIEQRRIAASLREDTRKSVDQIESKIAEVHAAATTAFSEANHTNAKISDLNRRLVEQRVLKDDTADKLDQIQTTAESIETKVDEIKGDPR